MTWRFFFDVPFVLLMLGPIGIFVRYWIARQLRGVDADRAHAIREALRPNLRRLDTVWLGTLAFGVVWGTLTMLGREPFGSDVNVPVLLGVIGFHAIWWPFAMPIFQRLEKLLEDADVLEPGIPRTPTRTAELHARNASDYLPSFAIPLAVALGVFGPLALAVWIANYPFNESRFMIMTLAFGGMGVVNLLLLAPVLRACTSSRIVLAPGQHPDEAERLRRYRVRWGYGTIMCVSVLMLATAGLIVLIDRGVIDEQTGGIAGGLTGGAIGLVGGFIGIRASIREYQLRRKRTAGGSPNA